jgi:adenine deaminase
VRIPGQVTNVNFELFLPPGPAPVIGIIPKQIITRKLFLEPLRDSRGAVRSDPVRDLLKIAVVERHQGSGRTGLGLVQGLGLREGAVASSVAHDSHNIIVAGVEERAMAAAVNTLRESGGGFVAVDGSGKVRALLPLPVAGLMSEKQAEEVAAGTAAVTAAARSLGAIPDNPYLTLSFLALPVIPELKITDRGLVEL